MDPFQNILYKYLGHNFIQFSKQLSDLIICVQIWEEQDFSILASLILIYKPEPWYWYNYSQNKKINSIFDNFHKILQICSLWICT